MRRSTCGLVAMVVAGVLAGSVTPGSAQNLSWEYRGGPAEDLDITEIEVDPEEDGLWYVATPSGLFVTRDGGDSWSHEITGVVGAIEIDPNDPNVIYAGVGFELFWSSNRGLSWDLVYSFPDEIPGSPQNAPTFIDSILVSTSEGTVLVGLSTTFHSARVYMSEDGGNEFDIVFESPSGLHIWDLAEIPSNGYWFFCTEDSSHLVDPVVMRSRDRGATWEEMTPLTGYLTSGHGLNLEVHPWTEVVTFLSEATVLRYSVDSGDSWPVDYSGRGFGSSLLVDAACPNRLFGGEMVRGVSTGGVFVSDDNGISFTFQGMSNHTISSLAINGTSTTLYAASYGSGIWMASIDGVVECTQDVLLFADGVESGDTYRWGEVMRIRR